MIPKMISILYMDPKLDNAALEYGINLSEMFDSYLDGLYVAPSFENVGIPISAYGVMAIPDAPIIDLRKADQKRRKASEESFNKITEAKKAKNACFYKIEGLPEDVLTAKGRVSDLIIIPRTDDNVHYNNAANGALFGSGCPVLFVPPEYKKPFNGKTLIAWDGSRLAANAVHRAMPYLRHGKVSILSEMEGTKKQVVSAEELKTYLGLHDIHAEIVPVLKRETPLPISILNIAKALDTGMIIMGGWGHSRFRELVLGGVTDYMLNNADIPVLMAH